MVQELTNKLKEVYLQCEREVVEMDRERLQALLKSK